ncbi:uncharacterized protein LOC108904700 [Anoplophora glabripennis]|uniref:uncharacterized protein LOC108904700 n=1 Tax=Anoplophora glabripennis TaxID=217634 RepID=UPI000874E082|nr:uncharacterized protein LOC108904700 [Anoplophora glabripennis]
MLCRLLLFTVFFNYLLEAAYCDESGNFFLKVSKSVPRIGKRGKGSPEFEKFFLKASKSVPRIGRRNENPFENQNEVADNGYTQTRIKYPTWSELADRYEYDPELFSSPQLLRKLEEEIGDDPTLYDWEKVRLKRNVPGQNRRH